ncbi:MAG: 3,8-cyclase [Clostridiales bacterium]|nr:3,8-cyclase [Clostridiales bacterium]
MKDQYGREIDYIRISVTDRCNLRCKYCMPEEGVYSLQHEDILTYEEIIMLCHCFAKLGIKKVKLTGGEPLVRKGFVPLVKKIKEIPGIEEVTMTTNGILLEEYLEDLKAAGLDAINISLDSLNPEKYKDITRQGDLSKVMKSIERAAGMGFRSIKINALIISGFNEDDIVSLASLAKDTPVSVRFIEMMPIGEGGGYSGISQADIMNRLEAVYGTLTPYTEKIGNGPATYYELLGFQGKIGFISAISHEFCEDCNRIRVTADGNLKLCLQYQNLLQLKEIIASKVSEEELTELLRMAIFMKPRKHDFQNKKEHACSKKETKSMVQIGG